MGPSTLSEGSALSPPPPSRPTLTPALLALLHTSHPCSSENGSPGPVLRPSPSTLCTTQAAHAAHTQTVAFLPPLHIVTHYKTLSSTAALCCPQCMNVKVKTESPPHPVLFFHSFPISRKEFPFCLAQAHNRDAFSPRLIPTLLHQEPLSAMFLIHPDSEHTSHSPRSLLSGPGHHHPLLE